MIEFRVWADGKYSPEDPCTVFSYTQEQAACEFVKGERWGEEYPGLVDVSVKDRAGVISVWTVQVFCKTTWSFVAREKVNGGSGVS